MTWEKRYRRGQRVRERDFHDDLHERLLKDPELGGRVERNEPLALGYLDVRHDGITAELKVERNASAAKASLLAIDADLDSDAATRKSGQFSCPIGSSLGDH
jgi:hypothetical protein